jgi:hypothetical protein
MKDQEPKNQIMQGQAADPILIENGCLLGCYAV